MKINRIYNTQSSNNINPAFKGINIAHVAEHDIKIYKITQKDNLFLNNLGKQIQIKKLIPELSDDGQKVYKSILNTGLVSAQSNLHESMLLTYKDTACGIIVNTKNKTKYYVNYICTFPIKPKEKAPLGATTMFLQMFKEFLNDSNASFIELDAIRYGSAISKYLRLGFKPIGGDDKFEKMRISRNKIMEVFEKLKEKINLVQLQNQPDIDLTKVVKFPKNSPTQ